MANYVWHFRQTVSRIFAAEVFPMVIDVGSITAKKRDPEVADTAVPAHARRYLRAPCPDLARYLARYFMHYLARYLVRYLSRYFMHYLVRYLIHYLARYLTRHLACSSLHALQETT
ncbi:hypothetical protein A0H81_11953 [Grifola frondosa]|uniref:Uncharacterized protein n=1 Tax=Grifola frondosa TaxID=5627 RepID=A0A1C7LZN2_GRIFR|nr:hypothetical protein A0H81_11953 [Grifola frondosa]